MLRLALDQLVEIVGEAAKPVTAASRAELPTLPWSAASRMSDRLVHHYFDIDLDVLWSTVTGDLPALAEQLADVDLEPGDEPSRPRRVSAGMDQMEARKASRAAFTSAGASCWTQWPAPATIVLPRKSVHPDPGSANESTPGIIVRTMSNSPPMKQAG